MERDARSGPELPARLASHLRDTGWVRPGDAVLVALSGGLDSVVLLHLLRFGLRDWELAITAAHFDHAMRPGSVADAAWVRGLCRAWSVRLESDRAERVPGSEVDARRMRYAFLEAAVDRTGARRMLTAHQRDDQAETVLFRLARGTGLRGLAGIPARRGRIVRPLLPFGRAELERYAAAVRLRHREDPTNRDLSFARNRIRHVVLPELERMAPGTAERIAALARSAAASERAWDSVSETLLEPLILEDREGSILLARDRLLGYHPSVQARLLRRLLRRFGSAPDRAGTRAALEFIKSGASGAEFHVAGAVRIEREFDRLRIRRAGTRPGTSRPLIISAPGDGRGSVVVGGRRYEVKWRLGPATTADGAESFAPSALRFPLMLRPWQPGDRIRLPYGSKKLKKLFGERRVGRWRRGRIPVLVSAASEDAVLWVPGVARSGQARPGDGEEALTIMIANGGHD